MLTSRPTTSKVDSPFRLPVACVPCHSPDMRMIRRYSNRKLYDTQDSHYVTLAQIAALVALARRSGSLARKAAKTLLPPRWLRSSSRRRRTSSRCRLEGCARSSSPGCRSSRCGAPRLPELFQEPHPQQPQRHAKPHRHQNLVTRQGTANILAKTNRACAANSSLLLHGRRSRSLRPSLTASHE